MKENKDEEKKQRIVPTEIVVVKSDKLTTVCRVLFFAFVFLFALEFLGKNYIWLYMGFAFFAVTTTFVRFRVEIIVLAALSLCMIFFSGALPSWVELLRIFAYPLCYLVGSNLWVEKDTSKWNADKQEKLVSWSILAFALGSFVHLFINFLLNVGNMGVRNLTDLWSGAARSATNQAALALLMIAVSVAVICSGKRTREKILAFAILAVIVAIATVLAGRTLFVIMLVVAAVAFLFMWGGNRNRNKTIWVTTGLCLIVVLLVAFFYFNAFGLRDRLVGSNFYQRFFGDDPYEGLGETGRWSAKLYYLDHFFENVWGGAHMLEESGGYAHDVFLDTYDQYGLIALLSVVAFILIGVYQTARFVMDRRFSFSIRQLVLCVNIALFIEFMVEPIFYGFPWLFCVFCFIQGAIANARQNVDLTGMKLLRKKK